ncbi:hypothetical protein ColTof4_14454 [Colletotrichum tofieldiae]|nr:hypothetical protein ColTof3_14823 [Colletotrichum tofieldiae]GKT82031.1 hypothetical protein ColTof4_14454 [Colletotrichum tofieldiae]
MFFQQQQDGTNQVPRCQSDAIPSADVGNDCLALVTLITSQLFDPSGEVANSSRARRFHLDVNNFRRFLARLQHDHRVSLDKLRFEDDYKTAVICFKMAQRRIHSHMAGSIGILVADAATPALAAHHHLGVALEARRETVSLFRAAPASSPMPASSFQGKECRRRQLQAWQATVLAALCHERLPRLLTRCPGTEVPCE